MPRRSQVEPQRHEDDFDRYGEFVGGYGELVRGPIVAERGSHGLHPTTNPFHVDPKFHVHIKKKLKEADLLDILDGVSTWVTKFHAYFAKLPGASEVGAVGKYHRLGNALDKTRAKIIAGTLRPLDFGNLELNEVERFRRGYTLRLSGSLTKLRNVADIIEREGVLTEKGTVYRWASEGLLILLASIQSTVIELVSLEMWERSLDDGPKMDKRAAVRGMILDAERNAERDAIPEDGGDFGSALRGVE